MKLDRYPHLRELLLRTGTDNIYHDDTHQELGVVVPKEGRGLRGCGFLARRARHHADPLVI